MAYCPNCGEELAAATNFCPNCGTDVSHVGTDSSDQTTQQSPQQPSNQRQPSADSQSSRRHSQQSRETQSSDQPGTQQQPPQTGQPPATSGSGVTRRSLFAAGSVAAAGAGWYFLLRKNPGTATNALSGGSSDPKPPLDQMQVEFVDVRQPDLGLTTATLPLIIAFRNPTNRPIPDISGDFDIYVNDTRVGSDELTVNKLEAGEETNVNLDVIIKYAEYGQALIDALKSGSFTVRVRGSVNAGGATRSITLTQTYG